MNAITTKKARRELDLLIDQVISDAEPAIICNDAGKKAVLISFDEFKSWQETIYLLSNPINAEHLRKSIAEAKTGKILNRELIES